MSEDKVVRKGTKAHAPVKDVEKKENTEKPTGSIYDASGIVGTVHDSIDLSDFTPSPLYYADQK